MTTSSLALPGVKDKVSTEERTRLVKLIDQAKKEGR